MESEARQLGPWTLEARLGEGGNASVWRARREAADESVALKVINATNANREPYQRFAREIDVLRRLTGLEGVLPILDAYLPEVPSRNDRAWLAMPIAEPMSVALAEAELGEVVTAMASVAGTLATLAADHGIGHRDIKPSNLYRLHGAWTVGDFGLVAVPDLDDLTRSSRPLGPAHYLAYEMLTNPARADPLPADVFSLAKTLWVLAARQNYPPQGHQRSDVTMFGIREAVGHAQAGALDRLIDRMTRPNPVERPTMAEVAGELNAWLALRVAGVTVDLSAARERLRRKLQRELAEEDRREARRDQAIAAARRLQELFRPINDALRDLRPRAVIDAADDQQTQEVLKVRPSRRGVDSVWRWQRCSRVTAGSDHSPYSLRVGRSLELMSDGELTVSALLTTRPEGWASSGFHEYVAPRSAVVGSVAAEQMLIDFVEEIAEVLPRAVDAFVESARGDDDTGD